MIIFYSGEGSRSNPEITLADDATLMLTFHDMVGSGRPTKRFQAILDEISRRNSPPWQPREGVRPEDIAHLETRDIPVGVPSCHFFDSGSFTLWTRAEEFARENRCGEWEFYDTDEFWSYVDSYVEFINKYQQGIDHYANIDVLPFRGQLKAPKDKTSHKLTWRNQVELEKRGLTPVPVVHYKAPMSVLERYLKKGYEYIGLGGLVGSVMQDSCQGWVDRCFNIICDTKDRLPAVDVHGFGVTGFNMMTSYPWHSVDSTSWTKMGAYGNLLVPHKRGGQFVFDRQPYLISVSFESPKIKTPYHLLNLTKGDRQIVEEWLEFLDIPLGEWHYDEEGKPVEETKGIVTHHTHRRVANLLFFEESRKQIELKPFQSTRPKGFGFLQ